VNLHDPHLNKNIVIIEVHLIIEVHHDIEVHLTNKEVEEGVYRMIIPHRTEVVVRREVYIAIVIDG